MDHMNPLDASFLYLENGTTHMHIASCAVFEGPPPPYDDVVALFASKLPLVPRYRQRVRFVPMDLGRPVWVDDPNFDLECHIRHTALAPPGRQEDLESLMGRLMSQELERSQSPWEAWIVEGLEGGRWAIISKVHHCMVDGVAGVDLISLVLDSTLDTAPVCADEWNPGPEPSSMRLAVDAITDLLKAPGDQLRAIRAALMTPRHAWQRARRVAAGAEGRTDRRSGGRRRRRSTALSPTSPLDLPPAPRRHSHDPQDTRRHCQRRRARRHHERIS
jgi:WS/DGAT/MGAT family acyltransferase